MAEKLVIKCTSCFAIKDPDTGEFVPYTDPKYKALHDVHKSNLSHGLCDDCYKSKTTARSDKRVSRETIL